MDKSADKTENVEFYQEILRHHKTTGKTDETNESTEPSPESHHAPDTDFTISSVANTTMDSSVDKPLPSISRPKTRYQLRLEQKAAKERISAIEKEKSDLVEINSESQKSDEIEVGKSDEAKQDQTPSITSVDNGSKSEISDKKIDRKKEEDDKSEISELKDEETSTGVDRKKDIGINNKSNRKRLLLSLDFIQKPPKKKNRRGIQKSSNEVSSKDTIKSEISENKIGLRTRSKTNSEEGKEKPEDKIDEEQKKDDDIKDYFYSCKICTQSFQNHDKYKKHKLSCKRTSIKHVCSKCSKSFG